MTAWVPQPDSSGAQAPRAEVAPQLHILQSRGHARRDAEGRWMLTDAGRSVLRAEPGRA